MRVMVGFAINDVDRIIMGIESDRGRKSACWSKWAQNMKQYDKRP